MAFRKTKHPHQKIPCTGLYIMEEFKQWGLNKRINAKALSILILGVRWEDLTKLGFSYREKIELLIEKLDILFTR